MVTQRHGFFPTGVIRTWILGVGSEEVGWIMRVKDGRAKKGKKDNGTFSNMMSCRLEYKLYCG